MRIVLIGAKGRMGQEVCRVARGRKDNIVLMVDKDDKLIKVDADVIIDFSTCDDRCEFIEYAKKNFMPYCCFATAISQKDRVLLANLSNNVPVLLCSNASLGMNVMFEVVDIMCKKLSNTDIVVTEYHHKNKKDCPSGTALKLQKIIDRNGKIVQLGAYRVANEFGTHKIQFFLDDEVVEITHKAYSRKTFAEGALQMAEELLLNPRGLYEI